MEREKNLGHGLKWGLILGVLYCGLVYSRYHFGASNTVIFSALTSVGYLAIMGLLLFSGFQLRKKNGGYIEFKEVFKILFLSVLIFELFFGIFDWMYIKYIDPLALQKLRDSAESLLRQAGESQDKIDQVMKGIEVDRGARMGVTDMLKSYLVYISMGGIFSLIFSAIIKRKPPVSRFPESDNFQ